MQLLTVVLGRPGTIGFATGLAHPRAPNLWGKQGWYTGQGIIAWDLTHGNYGSTTWTDSFVDSLLGKVGWKATLTQPASQHFQQVDDMRAGITVMRGLLQVVQGLTQHFPEGGR